MGGYINVFISFDQICYYVVMSLCFFDMGLDIFLDVIWCLLFEVEEFLFACAVSNMLYEDGLLYYFVWTSA